MKNFLPHRMLSAIVIAAIGATALFLRLFYYMGVVRGDDFAYTNYAYELSIGALDLSGNDPGLNRPGLYGPAALFFRLLGPSEFTATLFPLLASLLTIFFIYKIALMLSGQKVALLAAFLWAVFPLDIFMATQLDPETPLAMATTGAVYALLAALHSSKTARKTLYFFLCALFLVWSFNIKPSGTPIVFALIALLLIHHWPGIRTWVTRATPKRILKRAPLMGAIILATFGAFILFRQPWPIFVNNLELTSYDIAPSLVLGRENPLQQSDLKGPYWSVNRKIISPPIEAQILTGQGKTERINLFDPILLLFAIGAAYILLQRRKGAYPLLIWFGIPFFYLEWGPFPRTLSSAISFVYTPLLHWVAADNLLYICVPVILVVAFYISQGLIEENITGALLLAVFLVIVSALLLDAVQTRQFALNYINLGLVLLSALALASPFILLRKIRPPFRKSLLFGALLPLVGISSLIPSSHYHVSGFFKEQERRENLRAIDVFLNENPDLPLYAGYASLQLDVYSGFKYGYSLVKKGYNYPETRMTNNSKLVAELGGYYLEQGCGHPVTDFKFWPTAEFGEADSPECISLIQTLATEKALLELPELKRNAFALTSRDSISSYFDAAINARIYTEFVNAFSLLVAYFPDDAPIVQAAGIVQTYAHFSTKKNVRIDLLSLFQQEDGKGWVFGPELTPRVVLEDGKAILVVEIEQKTDEVQPISISLNLKSSKAYIMEIELRAFAPYDLLRFPKTEIPDSFLDSWNRDLGWTRHSIVFITPHWPDGDKNVMVELARVYDRGDIWFRVIDLVEVSLTRPL